MVLIEQGCPHVGVQRWFDIHCGGAIEPADRHSLIELPGAVRSELRLFGLIERDVKQRGPTIPDVDPGAFQQFGRQRGKEAGTLGPERGVCGWRAAVGVELNHSRRRSRGLSSHPAAVENHDLQAGFGKLVGNRGSDGAGTNHDDVRTHESILV